MTDLFAYVVRRDFGFAPNPFFGVCTLATCKPDVRRHARLGDWVAGTGSVEAKLHGRLIYAMRVDDAVTFDEYWADPAFGTKRPVLNGSLKQMFGDNIYHTDGVNEWIQAPSHHSLPDGSPNLVNLNSDTSANRVLISRKFVYFGALAPEIPAGLRSFNGPERGLGNELRGHRRYEQPMVDAVIEWLEGLGQWGWCGDPAEFSKARRIA